MICMRYARIENNTVAEFYTTELPIYNIFHADLVWVQCEDMSVQTGYLYDSISGVFSPKPVDPNIEKNARIVAIRAELDDIDLKSVRSLRAKLAGTATAEDDRILNEIEARAAVLRAELATLV